MKEPNPLKTIIQTNPRAWTDQKKFKSILMDYFPEEKARRNLLVLSAEEGIPDELVEITHISDIEFERMVKRLVNASGCGEGIAATIIEMWIETFGIVNECKSKIDENEIISKPQDQRIIELIINEEADPESIRKSIIAEIDADEPKTEIDFEGLDFVNKESVRDDDTVIKEYLGSEILQTRISGLGLSNRSFIALNEAGIESVADVLCLSSKELYDIKGFGDKSREELSDAIQKMVPGPSGNNYYGFFKCAEKLFVLFVNPNDINKLKRQGASPSRFIYSWIRRYYGYTCPRITKKTKYIRNGKDNNIVLSLLVLGFYSLWIQDFGGENGSIRNKFPWYWREAIYLVGDSAYDMESKEIKEMTSRLLLKIGKVYLCNSGEIYVRGEKICEIEGESKRSIAYEAFQASSRLGNKEACESLGMLQALLLIDFGIVNIVKMVRKDHNYKKKISFSSVSSLDNIDELVSWLFGYYDECILNSSRLVDGHIDVAKIEYTLGLCYAYGIGACQDMQKCVLFMERFVNNADGLRHADLLNELSDELIIGSEIVRLGIRSSSLPADDNLYKKCKEKIR